MSFRAVFIALIIGTALTAKHGAFMGGADFVQWHGNYPILKNTAQIRAMAEEMRRQHDKGKK